jgi:hypothetical protein
MGSRRTSFLGKSDYFPMWIARHFPAVPGRGAIPVTTGQSPVASTGQSPAMSGSHCSPSGRLYPQEKTKACERRSAFLAPPAPTTKPRPLLRSASFATSPTPSSTTPWPGDRPTEPSGRMALSFPWGRAWFRPEPRSGETKPTMYRRGRSQCHRPCTLKTRSLESAGVAPNWNEPCFILMIRWRSRS